MNGMHSVTPRTAHLHTHVILPTNPRQSPPILHMEMLWGSCQVHGASKGRARDLNPQHLSPESAADLNQARESFLPRFSKSLASRGGGRQIARSLSWLLTGHIPECYEWPSWVQASKHRHRAAVPISDTEPNSPCQ